MRLRFHALAMLMTLGVLFLFPEVSSAQSQRTCVATSGELEDLLLRPANEKSGLTICLEPGRYAPLNWQKLRGVFQGLNPERPLIIESRNPDAPAILPGWQMSSRDSEPNGNLILRNLVIEIKATPAPRGERPFRAHIYGIRLGLGARTENFIVDGIVLRGNMGEAYRGAPQTKEILHGISGHANNVIIRDSDFTQIMNAIAIWGENHRFEFNRARRLWGDFVRLSAVPPGQGLEACIQSRRIVVRNNLIADNWSNNRFHPDVIHMFAHSGIPCGLRDVVIEGNIAFMGAEGTLQPGFPTNFEVQPIRQASGLAQIDTKNIQTLRGPGQVQLPVVQCPERPVSIAIQRSGDSTGPITLVPGPGAEMQFMRQVIPQYSLLGDWEMIHLRCPGRGADHWQVRPKMPGPQGFFTNAIKGSDGYKRMVIRHNIFWLTSGNGVDLRDPDNDEIAIFNNSFLQPFPGDRNGDGRANTEADGFNMTLNGTRMLVEGSRVLVTRNISSNLGRNADQPNWRGNDDGLRSNDQGASMMLRFTSPTGRAEGFFPVTAGEAVSLARPKAAGPLARAQVGALGATPATDLYDFSWVPQDWPLSMN